MFHKRQIIISFIAALLTVVLLACARGFLGMISLLNPVERALENFRMTDFFCDIENGDAPQDTSEVITIVDMSEVFDRAKLAEIVETIDSLQPAVIGVDIRFDGEREDISGNERLVEAVLNVTSPIIWANELSEWSDKERQFTKVLHSFFVDYGVEVEEGFTNVHHDLNGGTVRTYGIQRQAEGHTDYSLPARLAVAMTGDSTVLRKSYDCNIRYSSTHFPVIPYDKIAESADQIRNRIVLMGAMNDKRDTHYSPMGLTPGPSIIAFAVNTLINNSSPRELSFGWMALLSLFLIWLAEVLHDAFLWLMGRVSWLRMVAEAGILDGIYTLLYMMLVIIMIDYAVFKLTNFYFDTAFIIMSIFLLDTSRAVYDLIIEKTGKNKKRVN